MKIRLASIILIIVVIGIPLFAACAKQAAPEEVETKGEIVVGLIDDLSGPLAGLATGYKDGIVDAVRYINEDKGGIAGHQLRLVIIDYKLDSTLATAGWARLKGDGASVVLSSTGGAASVLHPLPDKDRIAFVTWAGTMGQIFPREPSFYFGCSPVTVGQFESGFKLMQQEWTDKGKSGTPRIGLDFISIGNYGKIWNKAAQMAANKLGWETMATFTSLAPVDVTTQVLKMKDFGADFMFIASTEQATIAWFKDLERQNFRPVVYGGSGLASGELWNALGETIAGATAWQVVAQWTETDVPGVQLMHELNERWHPDVTWRPGHYSRGFADFRAVAEGVRRAVDEAGYENLDGDAVRGALETIKDYDPMEMGLGYSWTPTDHQGLHGCRWYRWTKDGTLVPVGDWDNWEPLPEEQRTDSWWLTE
jgi:branched-chain amino acid transport system substrate-binding protein